VTYPHPFRSAADLIARGRESGLDIAAMMRANEAALRSPAEVAAHVDLVIAAMLSCIERGLAVDGELPGGLKVKRRFAQRSRRP
jgi:L-serine dehydratase